jgi:hypothetical protein
MYAQQQQQQLLAQQAPLQVAGAAAGQGAGMAMEEAPIPLQQALEKIGVSFCQFPNVCSNLVANF